VAVASGVISTGSFFGSFVPSQGEVLMSRSRNAALKAAATMPWMTCTVAGDRARDRPVTHACTSLGRIEPSRRWPKVG
jgi:hypothetical protein